MGEPPLSKHNTMKNYLRRVFNHLLGTERRASQRERALHEHSCELGLSHDEIRARMCREFKSRRCAGELD